VIFASSFLNSWINSCLLIFMSAPAACRYNMAGHSVKYCQKYCSKMIRLHVAPTGAQVYMKLGVQRSEIAPTSTCTHARADQC
jgi:hypothetical protein